MPAPGFLSVRCPSCQASSDRVPASLAGRTVRCPRCSSRFAVPVEGAAAATVPEAAAIQPTVLEDGALAPTRAEPPSPGSASPSEWQAGDVVLGLYEVRGVLGEGGMGRVYRVRHRGWGLDLAVKAPLPRVLEAAGGADLFEREAETWVSLGLHPHVVTCHYVRRANGRPLVFAEYVDGGSLHDAIRTGRFDSAPSLLDVAIQFAWGLHHAHEHGLVHRDVKPANVMLTRDGMAKVTDFGLARARSARVLAPAGPGAGHTLTVEGGGGGTPAYVAPEQAAGKALNRRADLWSFGLSVLEAFLGGRRWEYGLAAAEVLEAYRRDGLRADGRPAMPEPVADLLARCFRERPEERPHDLAEVASTLRAAWETLAGRPYPRREPRAARDSADSLNNRAVSLLDLGRAGEAEVLWRRALETEAQHVEATYNAGLAAWAGGRLPDPELLRRMEGACASRPGLARGQQLLGRLHLMLDRTAEALVALERAAALGGGEGLDHDLAAARSVAVPPLRTLRGLSGPVAALSLSSDGGTVAAGSGGEVRVWDATSEDLRRTISVRDGPVRSLALLSGGRFLVVGLENAPLGVWDLATGRPVRSWARHAGFAACLAVLPSGRFVLSGGSDRVVRLWDPASGRVIREMPGHEDAVTAVAAGEKHLLSASRDGTARLWALEDGRCLATLRGHRGRVLAVALDERQARVVTAGEDGTVRDWGLSSRECVRVWSSHGQAVEAVSLSPDGARILSASVDRTVRAFDGEQLVGFLRLDAAVHVMAVGPGGTPWAGHGTAVSALPAPGLRPAPPALCRPASASEEEARASSFHASLEEARRSLTGGDLAGAVTLARRAREVPGHERADAALAVWDDLCARLPRQALRSAWEESRLEGHEDQVLAVAVGGSGSTALTGGLDATLRLWDLVARRPEATLLGHDGAVTAVALAGSGRAVSAGRDRTVRLWDLAGRRAVAVLEGHRETVTAVDATPDGVRAASAGADGTVRLWDLRRHGLVRVLEGHGAQVAAVRLSPEGQVVASASWDGTARLWDADSGRELAVLDGREGSLTAVALHADGRQVATGSEGGAVCLWDARSRRRERELGGHEGGITGLAFTPDGRFLLSGSRDRTVRVFDLRHAAIVRTLPHPAPVLGLALTPAGSVLLTACSDRCVRLWHLDWEPEPPPAIATTPAAKATAPPGRESVRVETPQTHVRATTLREDLRRAAPVAVPLLPQAARKVPWRRVALGAGLLAAVAIAWLGGRRPARGVRLSPYMARAVPREVDLVDLEPYRPGCSPGDYERHLAQLRGGNPDARDVACLAARGTARVVADVLDAAPLVSDDPMEARRRRRNAASVLAGLEDEAVDALCARLADDRAEVREVVALALGVRPGPAASNCVEQTLRDGVPRAHAAAAAVLRQRAARGLVPAGEAWALTGSLLASPDPDARLAGLTVAPLFAAELAEPVVRPLQDDPDPEVAATARDALAAIARVRRTDQLGGGDGS